MSAHRRLSFRRVASLGSLMAFFMPFTFAQYRVNDKDVESLMRNLRDDAKAFQPNFNSAIKKSTIRKTSREKDARNLVALFEKQSETMLNNFKRTKKGDTDLTNVLSTAQQIDRLVYEVQLAPQATSQWQKIQSELQQLSSAFGMTEQSSNPRGITTAGPAANGSSCSIAVGTERANRLVEECLAVSPATRPPCNSQNSCALIIDEIKRGCAQLRQGAPAFCAEYR